MKCNVFNQNQWNVGLTSLEPCITLTAQSEDPACPRPLLQAAPGDRIPSFFLFSRWEHYTARFTCSFPSPCLSRPFSGRVMPANSSLSLIPRGHLHHQLWPLLYLAPLSERRSRFTAFTVHQLWAEPGREFHPQGITVWGKRDTGVINLASRQKY